MPLLRQGGSNVFWSLTILLEEKSFCKEASLLSLQATLDRHLKSQRKTKIFQTSSKELK